MFVNAGESKADGKAAAEEAKAAAAQAPAVASGDLKVFETWFDVYHGTGSATVEATGATLTSILNGSLLRPGLPSALSL